MRIVGRSLKFSWRHTDLLVTGYNTYLRTDGINKAGFFSPFLGILAGYCCSYAVEH